MRNLYFVLCLLLAGCAAHSLKGRKKEKQVAYRALTPEFKALVDREQIEKGMSEDAVYVALGKPEEILEIQDPKGPAAKWLYKGIYRQEEKYSVLKPTASSVAEYNNPYSRSIPVMERRNETTYSAHDYVKIEVDFVNGVVTKWQRRPEPR